jgi:CRISPR system Cascade subunit CasD
MQFLLFTLYGPFAAHGEVAVGERRMGWDRPARSAILGMVAGALGIDRSDEATHRWLDDGLWYAVRTDAVSRPWIDYQTTQVPSTRRNQVFAPRRDELAADNLNTILSMREWRSNALYTAVLWRRAGSEIDLDHVATALSRPHFALYAGRKAGPLGWPPNPRIVEAETLLDALKADPQRGDPVRNRWLPATPSSLAFDADAQACGAPTPERTVSRRDRVVSRTRWQFGERQEGIIDRIVEEA